MTSYSQKFYSPKGDNINEIFDLRIKKINELSNLKVDYLITELFPFGRRKFRSEILTLINNCKKANQSVKILCSARDILVDPLTKEIISDLESYDKIFVHSDPAICSISIPELSNEQTTILNQKVIYTGYITSGSLYPPKEAATSIIVSFGGGAVGEKQLYTVLESSKLLPNYQFHIITGVNSKAYDNLKTQASQLTNVTVSFFIHELEPLIARSSLSINMGGYNTLMNLATTKTFGLCFAYDENLEQEERIKIFENLGLVKLLKSDINPMELSQLIAENINRNVNELYVNLNGAKYVQEYLTQGKYEVS